VTPSTPARPSARRVRIRWLRVAGLGAVVVASAVALGSQAFHSSSSSSSSPPLEDSPSPRLTTAASAAAHPPDDRRGALGRAGGAVPKGTTVFDGEVPGVANLDRTLLAALRRAAADAADDGVELVVNSGWRSPAYQERLLDEAVAEYGSEEEAARWVATPTTSAHVSGDAVDIGPTKAAAWLADHGARYGLCRVYANEPWHYELRPEAVSGRCPPTYADPTQDPRTQ
jgi:hypothetical protein